MFTLLKNDLKKYILAKNKVAANVIRTVLSIISNDGFKDSPPDETVLNIIRKEIKKRKEAIELYSNNNREDLAMTETEEMNILLKYLPKQISEDELRLKMQIIKDRLSHDEKLNIGQLIKSSIQEFSDIADNSMISKIAKDLIKQ